MNLDEMRAQVEILRWCKQKRAEIKELEDTARSVVQDALGDDDTGTVDGEVAVTWKTSKRRALDQKALAAAHPDLVEEFKTATEVRRFEVVDD